MPAAFGPPPEFGRAAVTSRIERQGGSEAWSPPHRLSWATWVLRISAAHSLAWGAFIILAPITAAACYGFDRPPAEIFLWRGVGFTIFVLGIGYLIAATDPGQHWLAVLLGLIAKVFGPIGLCGAVCLGEVSWHVLILLPVNDLLWWYPFGRIVLSGIRGGTGTDDNRSEIK